MTSRSSPATSKARGGPPPKPPQLSADQRLILATICDLIEENGVPPSWDEMAARIGQSTTMSRGRIARHIRRLVEREILEKDERLSSRNLFPRIDPLGRPLERQAARVIHRPIIDPFAGPAETLLRAAVPVLRSGARELGDCEQSEAQVRLAQHIEAVLRHYRDG